MSASWLWIEAAPSVFPPSAGQRLPQSAVGGEVAQAFRQPLRRDTRKPRQGVTSHRKGRVSCEGNSIGATGAKPPLL